MNKYAYVTVLYGSNEYYLGTLLLGYSLKNTNTEIDLVVLVTPDVNEKICQILSDYFIVTKIDYIKVNTINFADGSSRFEEVFTKLQALTLEQYEKIILLDSDMFVVQNMDHLFELEAPAGLFRSIYMKEKPALGGLIDKSLIKIKGSRVNGIVNAGLLLLIPSKKELDSILNEVNTKLQYKLVNPEQEYLSWRYRGYWHYIGKEYNYQFSDGTASKNALGIHQIYNLHYSWLIKPWDLLFENKSIVLKTLKKEKKRPTYYYLWVDEFNILNKKYQKKGIDLMSVFEYVPNTARFIELSEYKSKH